MATTGQQVFELAVVLIDEMPDTGIIVEASVASYKVRTPAILTLLVSDLAHREGLEQPGIITDLNADLGITDKSARMILPYGLAYHLILDENPTIAGTYLQVYEEQRRKVPRSFVATTDVYNVCSDMR